MRCGQKQWADDSYEDPNSQRCSAASARRDEVDAIRLGKPVEASTHFADAQVFRIASALATYVRGVPFRDGRLTGVLPERFATHGQLTRPRYR